MKLGYSRGSTVGKRMPVLASTKVYPYGGFFVVLDGTSYVSIALDGTDKLHGWGKFPTSLPAGSTAASNGYYTADSTALVDYVFVYDTVETLFWMPVNSSVTSSVIQGIVGDTCDITGVSSADGSAQEANVGTQSTDVMLIRALAYDQSQAIITSRIEVSINPAEKQIYVA